MVCCKHRFKKEKKYYSALFVCGIESSSSVFNTTVCTVVLKIDYLRSMYIHILDVFFRILNSLVVGAMYVAALGIVSQPRI
jgi:hypothetical protein